MLNIILQNFHLEKLFWIIKSKLKYIVFCGLFTGLIIGAFTFFTRTQTYMAQISLYVYTNPDYITDNGINISATDISNANSLLSSYTQILKSNSFLSSVIEDADLDPEVYSIKELKSNITSSAVSGTAVFKVNVFDENPYNAMLIANTIGKLAPQKIIDVVKSGGIEVLDEATLPTEPYKSTSVSMMILIGIVIGAGFTMVIFIITGLLDTRYRRVYEVEDMFNIPILGKVPQITEKNENGTNKVMLTEESPFVLRAAYNDIRTNLLFMGQGQKCPVFAVTGADYDEGKTTNAINVAIVFANMGKKTLLIDADLRNGNIASEFGIEAEPGLSEYLAELSPFVNPRRQVRENLDIITTGKIPPNPTDLLISERWKKLIESKKNEYDIIILDTPSIGVVADGIEVVNVATAFIVVVREWVSRFERENLIIGRLETVDANICGFIYNGIDVKSADFNHKDYVNGGEYGKYSNTSVQH